MGSASPGAEARPAARVLKSTCSLCLRREIPASDLHRIEWIHGETLELRSLQFGCGRCLPVLRGAQWFFDGPEYAGGYRDGELCVARVAIAPGLE